MAAASKSQVRLGSRIYYEITSRCNLRCVHCYGPFEGVGSDLDANRIIDFHRQIASIGVLDSVVTGGEPTLHERFDEVVDALGQMGRVVVTSNGTAVPPTRFVQLLNRNLNVLLQLSFDGTTREVVDRIRGNGTFNKVMSVINALVEAGLSKQVGLSMTLMRDNISQTRALLEFARARDLASVHFPYLLPAGLANQSWESIAPSEKQQVKVHEFLLSQMTRTHNEIQISVNRIDQVLNRLLVGASSDCLREYTLKIDSDGNILPCPATANCDLSVGSVLEPDCAEDLVERLANRVDEYNELARQPFDKCYKCMVNDVCSTRFCEACGLLLDPPLPAARNTACSVLHNHYASAIKDSRQWLVTEAKEESPLTVGVNLTRRIRRAREQIEANRDLVLETVVPLYLTNYCDGECKVCAMQRNNKYLKRIEGSASEIHNQLRILYDVERVSAVSLLTGEFKPGSRRISNLECVVTSIFEAFGIGFQKIYVNIGSLRHDEIEVFENRFGHDDRIVLCVFQETYNRGRYGKFFGKRSHDSPKSDFNLRISTPRRWVEHGFKHVNIGILLGLGPPYRDVRQLILHATELHTLDAEVAISIPRIRGLAKVPHEVSDEEFKEIVIRLAEECPWSRIVLTTREPISLIKELLPVIGVISPGTSDVLPYTASGCIPNDPRTSQFHVATIRPRPSWVLDAIRKPNMHIRYYRPILVKENGNPPP